MPSTRLSPPECLYDSFDLLRVETPVWVEGAVFSVDTQGKRKLVNAAPTLLRYYIKGQTWKQVLANLREGEEVGWLKYKVHRIRVPREEKIDMWAEWNTSSQENQYRKAVTGRV